MAFSKNLEEIIEAALADGVITEKERAVLHKKALQEGVDPDEVDVVIDGRLQQMQNEVDKAKQKVRKCPSCGEIIPAMTAVCPNCGQVIDTSNPDNKALQKYMNKLEKTLVDLKEGGASKFNNKARAELESLVRQGKSLYADNKKINFLISEVEASIAQFEKKHKMLFIMKIVGIVVIFIILGGLFMKCTSDYNSSKEKEKIQHEEICNKSEKQYEELTKQLDDLDTPNKANYKEVENQLLKITWKDIPGDDTNYKESYLEKKRGLAEQIGSVVVAPSELYGTYEHKGAPDQIRCPSLYINN